MLEVVLKACKIPSFRRSERLRSPKRVMTSVLISKAHLISEERKREKQLEMKFWFWHFFERVVYMLISRWAEAIWNVIQFRSFDKTIFLGRFFHQNEP